MSKIKLSNRKYSHKYEWKPMPNDFIQNLCEKYDFKDSKLLKNELEEIWLGYGAFVRYEFDKKTIKDQLKALKELQKSCKSLLNVISSLGQPEKSVIHLNTAIEINYDSIESNVRALMYSSKSAHKIIEKQKKQGGRPKEDSYKNFVFKLARLYAYGTGKNPKTYWNDYENCYQGRALDFIEEFSIVMSVEKKPIRLGDILKKVLKDNDKGKNP